VIEPLNQDVV